MFNKISNLLFRIPQDKWIHFTVCLIIALVVYGICNICGLGVYGAIPAFVLPMFLGVVKEIADRKSGGEFGHYDLVADFLGTFVAMCIIALMIVA
jgi:VanZ family protein